MTNKINFFFFLLFISIQIQLNARPAEYSEATDVFELTDNVSRWHPVLSPYYRTAWEKKFPIKGEDKEYFDKYAVIRKRYYVLSGGTDKQKSDIFGTRPFKLDFFAESFYQSKSINEALTKLEKKKVSKDDLRFLVVFYKHFKSKISEFVKESTHFNVRIMELNKLWKQSGSEKTTSRLRLFVLGKDGGKSRLVFRPVWWPEFVPPVVDFRGPYLILRYHPVAHTKEWGLTYLRQIATQAILQAQSGNQRDNLTKLFEAKCPGRSIELQEMILLTFTELLPTYYKSEKTFDLFKKWSPRNYTDVYTKLMFPLLLEEIKSRQHFAGKFMSTAAEVCAQIHELSINP